MIYVNARFLTQEMTGVQRFAEMISLELNQKVDNICFLSPSNIVRADIASQLNVRIIGRNTGHLWEQLDLPYFLSKQRKGVLVNLGNTAPILFRNKITAVHDITFLKFPESFSKKFLYFYKVLIPLVIKTSKHVITVSEFSKDEILKKYNLDKEKISVVYNAVNKNFSIKNIEKYNGKPYFLMVSSQNYHKNFSRALDGFYLARKHGYLDEFALKIIGAKNPAFNTQSYTSNLKEDVEFLGRVSDSQLANLYANATAFIFPSLYEGFGIPPLEAQYFGCPVIASNAASLPEVLSDSVLYFNPLSSSEIKDAMIKVSNDLNLREKLIECGYKNLKKYSWGDSASKLLSIINKI